jgi:hypothetical protein
VRAWCRSLKAADFVGALSDVCNALERVAHDHPRRLPLETILRSALAMQAASPAASAAAATPARSPAAMSPPVPHADERRPGCTLAAPCSSGDGQRQADGPVPRGGGSPTDALAELVAQCTRSPAAAGCAPSESGCNGGGVSADSDGDSDGDSGGGEADAAAIELLLKLTKRFPDGAQPDQARAQSNVGAACCTQSGYSGYSGHSG